MDNFRFNKSLLIILWASLLLVYQNIVAEDVKFEYFSFQNGLQATNINCVMQDSRGIIWIGTDNGLIWHDGYSFRNAVTNKNLENDINSSEIRSIVEDKYKNLWIGTYGSGLFCYNLQQEKFIPIHFKNEFSKKINYVYLDYKGNLWIGSEKGLVNFINPAADNSFAAINTQTFFIKKPEQNNIIFENMIAYIHQSPEDTGKFFWIGTNGGFYRFNTRKKTFESYAVHPQNSIRQIDEYDNANIIAGSWDGGLFLINKKSNCKTSDLFINEVNKYIGDKRVVGFVKDENSNLWVATQGGGIYKFSKDNLNKIVALSYKDDENASSRFISNESNCIFLDKSGIIWIGTLTKGLAKLANVKTGMQNYRLKDETTSKEINSINSLSNSNDKNHVWISTFGNGLFYFDPKTKKQIHFTSKINSGIKLQNNFINLCYEDNFGNLWISMKDIGLYFVPRQALNDVLANKTKNITPVNANPLISENDNINNYITKIYQASNGRIWIGSWTTLHVLTINDTDRLISSAEDLIKYSTVKTIFNVKKSLIKQISFTPVATIYGDSKGDIWVGTRNEGLLQIIEKTSNDFSFKFYKTQQGLCSNAVYDIFEDSKKQLWLATNAGLCKMDADHEKIISFNVSDGLFNSSICNITEDAHSNIWLSTTYGISCFYPEKRLFQNHFITGNYDYNKFNYSSVANVSDSTIVFSSSSALVYFNPDSVFSSSVSPPIFFTELKVDNKIIFPGDKIDGTQVIPTNINESSLITVPYDHFITIEFSALDYNSPQLNQYAYKFEGENSQWILLNANQRSITLSNLPRGTYLLKFKASNAEGVWNSEETALEIKILPPIWQSNYAFAIYLLVLILLFIAYRRITLLWAKEKASLETERIKRIHVEELNQLKIDFFTDISHECRTPLSLIINPLESILVANTLQDKLKNQIQIAYKNSKRLLRIIDELLDFSKLEKNRLNLTIQKGDIVKFTQEVCDYFLMQAKEQNIDFHLNSNINNFELWFDHRLIEKAIFNLVSNAFKYTPDQGMILVSINLAADKTDISESAIKFVKISIVNNGPGISKEDLPKIFERFYQAEQTKNQKYSGSGIGLSIVKSYIELHKGFVEVKSEPNVETSFDMYLPLGQNHFSKEDFHELPTDIKKEESFSLKEQTDSNDLNKEKFQFSVLIVEDNMDVRKYLSQEFSNIYNIHEAKDGKEGIEKAKQIIPDLIITDLVMPNSDGFELCSILKSDISTSHIPIIMLTAKTTIENQIEGIEKGADVYITKPFNIRFLEAQVKRLLEFRESIYQKFLDDSQLLPKGAVKNKLDEEFMQKVIHFIEENISEINLNVEQLSSSVNLSRIQVYRKIKAITGLAPVEFIRTIRLKKASKLILEGILNYAEIAYETGFTTPSYFTKCFREQFGKTPTEYAENHRIE